MEIQFVHYKESHGSLTKAMESDDWDSLAIISVFCYVISGHFCLSIQTYSWLFAATEQDPGSGSVHEHVIQCSGEHHGARLGDRDPLLPSGPAPPREPREILSLQWKFNQTALQ